MAADPAIVQHHELTGSHAVIYPIGSQLLWALLWAFSISTPIALCLGVYLALYYSYGKDAGFAAVVTISMLAILAVRLLYPGHRALFKGTFFDIPAYGFIDAKGIHYRRYLRMHCAPWTAIERLEYWPQNGGKIDLYLHKNPSPTPIRVPPPPSWSQHTAEELKSKPPVAIRYLREHLDPSAFQFGVASLAANNPPGIKIIDYLVAVGLLLLGVSLLLQWQTKAWHWAELTLLFLYLMVRMRIRWDKGHVYIIDPPFS